jgi:hypothetical protein
LTLTRWGVAPGELGAHGFSVPNQPVTKPWHEQLSELLARAAELCVEHDVDVDPFVRGAYAAYLDASPGMREELADRELQRQLAEMRKQGRLPTA